MSEETEKTQEQEPIETPQDLPLPEPSIKSLVSGLAAQAMMSLGFFPNPVDGKTEIRLHQGRHLIETVALLETKTKGNLTDEETNTLANALHELRMMYVAAKEEFEKRKG
ncbi:hypothetical protein FACS189443_0750 [Planctomycetales bacterium]|nr:hypothetical protein FACS189443_0750 [Planctomycetales bacterium]